MEDTRSIGFGFKVAERTGIAAWSCTGRLTNHRKTTMSYPSTHSDIVPFQSYINIQNLDSNKVPPRLLLAQPFYHLEETCDEDVDVSSITQGDFTYGSYDPDLNNNTTCFLKHASGWVAYGETEVGLKGRCYGFAWIKPENGMKVVMVNTDEYESVDEITIVATAKERLALEQWLIDFGFEDNEIVENDTISVTY